MKISVAINTYNAEKHLQTVLESVKDFDEILICDMYSTDRTIEIAQAYGCKIIYHENTGYVEPARAFIIQSARYPWVLVLDADEVVPVKLKAYLYDLIEKDDCPAGVRIPLKNFFMGRFMRCTYPNYILRFLKKEGTVWPPYIHSQPTVQGKVYTIPKKHKDLAFIHLANDSVKTTLNKMNQYTENETKKRKDKKYGYGSLLGESVFRFFKLYLFKGACLDGKAGLTYAALSAFYKFTTIAKIWESCYQYDDIDKELKRVTLK